MSLRLLSLFLCLLAVGFSPQLGAQTIATPTGDSGSGYPVFSAAGFGVEGPDESSPACVSTPASDAGNHKAFGPHIVQVADEELDRNVFAFISHITDDSDRCLVQDRVRIEVKGGPAGASDPELEHMFGDTSYYRWQFRLDEGFVGASSFCHLFQNKAQGGDNDGQPIVTLTARREVMELVHLATDNSSSTVDLAQVPLSLFRGKWVEVYMRQVHSDNGLLEVVINDVATGTPLLNYLNEDIDLWRETDSDAFINRPKWGIYRRRADGLRDETVRFANICASESSASICPSLLPASNGAPLAVQGALPIDSAANVPLGMPLTWNGSDGATSYSVYFGTTATPELVATVTDTFYRAALAAGTTYYYQIGAANEAGETRTGISHFTTLATADTDGWEVARGHAAPHVEVPEIFELNTNLEAPAGISRVRSIDGEEGNAAYDWLSGPKEEGNGNYRWRYRQEEGEVTTLVMRIAPLEGVNNLSFVEFYGLGWRQKIRLNRNNARFERTPDDPEFDFPEDFWQDGEYRILRFTFEPSGDNMLTTLYLDESSEAFASGLSDEAKTNNYLDIGRAGSTDYGASFDYLAVNATGAFAPDSTGAPALPTDLFGGGGGAGGTPLAVTDPLPLDGATNVPLTMPLAWTGNQAATSYNVYFGTTEAPELVGDTIATEYSVDLMAATTYYYQIGAVNDNGETRTEVRSFTTLADPNDGEWIVARGHAKPNVEVSEFFALDTNLDAPAALDTVIAIGDEGNTAFGYLSGPKEGDNGNYRWRFRQAEDQPLTLVLRMAPLADNNNLSYVEFYGLGWRQKIRLNQSTAKFEKTPDDPEFTWPEGYWQVDTFRVLRFAFAPTDDGNLLTKLYLDGAETPFAQGISDEDSDNVYLDIGRAGGTDYGAYFDYIAINPTGVFFPDDDIVSPLPADLIYPEAPVSLRGPLSFEPLILFPNPASGSLRVQGLPDAGGTYRIISVTGQLLRSGQLANRQLSLAGLRSGTYTLQVIGAGGKVYVGRFIKQ